MQLLLSFEDKPLESGSSHLDIAHGTTQPPKHITQNTPRSVSIE